MSRELPLCSSREVKSALERLGAYPSAKRTSGSHATYYRDMPNDRKVLAVIVLNKKEIPRGTLKNILSGLEITDIEFIKALS